MKKTITLFACAAFVATSASADIFSLYTDASSEAGFNERFESDDTTYIADTIDGSGIFGDGDALRMADLTDLDKPEVVWNSAAFGGSDITDAFRLDLDAFNNAVGAGSVDINLRFSDSGDSIGSKANQLNTISFEETSKLKINGSTVHTFTGATSVSFFVNVSETNPVQYTFGDQINTTLPVDSIATFVNGVLVDTRGNSVDGTGFDNTSGVNKLGFIGESDSKFPVDYSFDNVVLYLGADAGIVPEPATISLVLGALALAFAAYRRRR
jgi:hypothetical protein